MATNNSKRVFSNMIWRMAERLGAQGVTLILSIILARILDPEAYGLTALVTVFTVILQVFIDSGFGNALIQKKESDDLDFSSVFYFNLTLGVFLYVIMFFSAPLIADFYEKPELVAIVRVMSITLVISGLKNVQQAYVSKKMIFKKFFFSSLGGTVGAAIIGIVLALLGYGVWALVIQNLFNTTVDTIILWITVKWRPKKMFSFKRLRLMFGFGWKLLLTSIINTVFNNVRQLIIGKVYSSENLAFYNKGKQFPNIIVSNIINLSIDSVLLPALAEQQDNKIVIKNMTRRALKVSTFLVAPMMIGLAAMANSLVPFLLKDKWIPAIPFLQIFCLTFLFQPIQTSNFNSLKAIGRSDMFLRINIVNRCIDFVLILISIRMGVIYIALSFLISSLISQFIIMKPNSDLLGYRIREQIFDILPSFIIALIMGGFVYSVNFLSIANIWKVLLQIVVALIVYFGLAKLFNIDSLQYMVSVLKAATKENKNCEHKK